MGRNVPKAAVPVAGRSMLARAVEGAVAALPSARVVVVLPAEHQDLWEECAGWDGVVAVAGGAHRAASVAAGLRAAGEADVVLVHDAARCLTPPSVFESVRRALAAGARAVIPAVAVVDTIKTARPGPDPAIAAEAVGTTPARSGLRAVQTPQGFRRAALVDAHARAGAWPADRLESITDDARLMEELGEDVYLVPGDERALKITTELDLLLAEALLAAEGSSA
nr:2-C-methyl-D-erythritol 4-phosphate cytidylyltransferase [Zhihengliuella flava]